MLNTISVANLTWHLGRRPFWEVSAYLSKNPSDLRLAQIASSVLAISAQGRHHDLTPAQARTVISRLNTLQLIEFEEKFEAAFSKLPTTPLVFDVPEPLPEPHWKTQARPKLTKDKEELLEKLMKDAQEELRDNQLLKSRVLDHFERVAQELEDAKNAEQNLDQEPSYELADKPVSAQIDDKVFVLSKVVEYLHPLITQNLYTLTGYRDGVSVTLRYVSKKEVLALKHLHSIPAEREKLFCAMSIAAIDHEWCLSSSRPHQKALDFVNAWSDTDVIKFYEILLKLRNFIESLLPYVEALPFIKLFKDFWIVNRNREQWWREEFTAIPGISKIPPCEHLDLFIQECIIEEKAVNKIESEDTLALQIAGVANELAQSIQDNVRELVKARGLQINYMLFNEVPEVEMSPDGSFAVPSENSREEIIGVAQNNLSGKMDYHDMMMELLRKRRACFDNYYEAELRNNASRQPTPKAYMPPDMDDDDSYGGGSSTASEESLRNLREQTSQQKAFWEEANLNFSLESMDNIASRHRKRDLLIKGVDPYHETDQSIDLGPAKRIFRDRQE